MVQWRKFSEMLLDAQKRIAPLDVRFEKVNWAYAFLSVFVLIPNWEIPFEILTACQSLCVLLLQ
jgi:hypothetical protein